MHVIYALHGITLLSTACDRTDGVLGDILSLYSTCVYHLE